MASFQLHEMRRACTSCSLRVLCLPDGMSAEDLARLDEIVMRRRPVGRQAVLFHQGEPMSSIYAVRSGSVKSTTLATDGGEQITGFHLPGELIGLDAIATGTHGCTVTALETSSVCELPFDQLDMLSGQIPGLRRQLLRLMSREIRHDQRALLMLGQKNAEQRLATLLLNLSARLQQRGLSATRFRLSMPRGDIANYLGLAVETVSRLLARFQEQGLLQVAGREVTLLDSARLRLLVECEPDAAVTHQGRG